jgi:hypothetical protein
MEMPILCLEPLAEKNPSWKKTQGSASRFEHPKSVPAISSPLCQVYQPKIIPLTTWMMRTGAGRVIVNGFLFSSPSRFSQKMLLQGF